MADIRLYGDTVLRRKAAPITSFDDELKVFIRDLVVDMKEKDGVGLAAPQIGRSVRVAVVDASGGEENPCILINPEVIWTSDEDDTDEEGCLSIPDIRLKVTRPASVSVRAFNPEGGEYVIEGAKGLYARALQHEIDHLDGILFVDRALPVYRQLVAGKLKKLAKSHREKT